MRMPDGRALLAMFVSAVVGMLAGLVSLAVMGEPTPFTRAR